MTHQIHIIRPDESIYLATAWNITDNYGASTQPLQNYLQKYNHTLPKGTELLIICNFGSVYQRSFRGRHQKNYDDRVDLKIIQPVKGFLKVSIDDVNKITYSSQPISQLSIEGDSAASAN